MEKQKADDLHKYILSKDLLLQVEAETKRIWKVGSRSSYYSGIKKCLDGDAANLSLVERIMLDTATRIMERDEEPQPV